MSYYYNPFSKNFDLYSGNNPQFKSITYSDTYWDDVRFPFVGQQIDTSSGRIDYDYSELGIGFESNSRYTEEVIAMICQLPHSWKIGTSIHPHLHYIQNQNVTPNWLLEYRIYENSTTVLSSWTTVIGSNIFTYTSGSILQKYIFPEIDMSTISSLSVFIDFKLYRDTGNVSGLFSGSDSYTGIALSKEFDIHYEIDMPGSRSEYNK